MRVPEAPPVHNLADAVGKRVETIGTERDAILIKITGDAALIRYAEKDGGYHWVGTAGLRRREDRDTWPEPAWLQQARVSSRPPLVLQDILKPQYSQRALAQRAAAEASAPMLAAQLRSAKCECIYENTLHASVAGSHHQQFCPLYVRRKAVR